MSQIKENNIPITVHIMDKEYRIGCKEDERDSLMASAQYVDKCMREIRQSGKIFGSDRIAVMVALNIANEFLEQRKILDYGESAIGGRLQALQKKIESALHETERA